MEFKEAMRIWKRMCESNDRCTRCQIPVHGGTSCPTWVMRNPVEAEAILAKWAEEHPEKTIADDFYEKHPNAPRDDANTPYPCAKDCGYSKPQYCARIPLNCSNCWCRPLEEEHHESQL